ncbi:MlaD family protein [Tsukamurella sp. 8F]|uniref:MlaD family protein n=1 Tax=unclassified Tsukamurella TaxID=2633480 RepID=UPI0023BA150C|nr:MULTISPECIES: MlaD family protein [unclassified Tsukamurella]MDF0530743.1 MlaD family protein [Tsukamurella sp. 8J]MDF0587944.1 MlaD family protein [Tsukamurella sp. 8F]
MGASRSLLRVCVAAAVAVAAVATGAPQAVAAQSTLCAIMPDSIGLYPGNDVTQMGVAIGRVSSVRAQGDSVKVTFSVRNRELPASVRAVTRSTSILADRALELVGNYTSGPRLTGTGCITRDKTATPKSITQTTEAATQLVDSLTRGGADADIAQLVEVLDREMTDSVASHGKSILGDTSTLLSDPAGFVTDVSSIVSDMRPLLASTTAQWGQLLASLDHGPSVLQAYGQTVFPAVTAIYTGLPGAINMAADMVLRYGDLLKPTLDTAAAAIHLAASGARSTEDLIKTLPVFGNTVSALAGRAGAVRGYRITMPRVRVPTADPAAICARINARVPGGCSVSDGAAQVAGTPLLQYVYEGGR